MFFKKKQAPGLPPEWMIVGLGNPGPEYSGTRHNVGFAAVDLLGDRHRIRLDKSKHRARYGLGMLDDTCVVLVKPLTFMNLSGQAVAPLAREYGIKPDHILVIADELDIPLGKLKMKPKGGPGGHNGHRSLIASLGTQEYPRIRIGIGKVGKGETIDHVLGSFNPEEKVTVGEMLAKTCQICSVLVSQGLDRALGFANEGQGE